LGDPTARNVDESIRTRLTKYLMRDEAGIRKSVLKLFLQAKSYTTGDVYDYLTKQGFDVNYRGVSAMVGLMNTRLGILRIDVTGDHNVYSLKEDHRDIVKTVLNNY